MDKARKLSKETYELLKSPHGSSSNQDTCTNGDSPRQSFQSIPAYPQAYTSQRTPVHSYQAHRTVPIFQSPPSVISPGLSHVGRPSPSSTYAPTSSEKYTPNLSSPQTGYLNAPQSDYSPPHPSPEPPSKLWSDPSYYQMQRRPALTPSMSLPTEYQFYQYSPVSDMYVPAMTPTSAPPLSPATLETQTIPYIEQQAIQPYSASTSFYSLPEFRYDTLDRSQRQIRLLRLFPRSRRALTGVVYPVCTIETISLDKDPTYAALSYVWGSLDRSLPIYLNSRRFFVTKNLGQALSYLERENESLFLWIDAVCINQSDDEEKSWQVQQMHAIYQQADHVVAWLGPDNADSDRAMDTLCDIGQTLLASHEQSVPNTAAVRVWKDCFLRLNPALASILDGTPREMEPLFPLEVLFKQPYWRRVWIVQEFALARMIHLVWGTRALPLPILKAICEANKIWTLAFVQIGDSAPVSSEIWQSMMFNRTEAFFMTLKNEISSNHQRPLLSDLLHRVRSTGMDMSATDPRDHIFALLGLVGDAGELEIRPDYSKPVAKVYVDVAKKMLVAGHLSILSLASGSSTVPDLPSWVPDWTSPIYQSVLSQGRYGNLFAASGPSSPSVKTGYPDCHSSIIIEGALLDTIASCTTYRAVESDPHYSEHQQRWYADLDHLATLSFRFKNADTPSITDFDNALWRISTAGIEETGIEGTPRRATRTSFEWYTKLRNGLQAKKDSPALDYSSQSDAYPFLVIKHARYRRAFVSSNGYLGLCPENTKNGDAIVIFLGASVPYVVRPLSGNRYHIVGETFVQDYMDGEFMMQNPVIEGFELV